MDVVACMPLGGSVIPPDIIFFIDPYGFPQSPI